MPVIPAFGKWKQEELKFQASLAYIARPALKNKQKIVTITICNDQNKSVFWK
jgi:hypothetical protein